jgi:hypothetical protein
MSESETSTSGERALCPKCGHKRTIGVPACPRCGLRFALWRPSKANLRAIMTPAGEDLWKKVETNWQDKSLHDEFVKFCLQSNQLPSAGRCYRDRLDRFPGDATASKMQAEILAKATLGMIVQKRQAASAPFTRSKWFWVIILVAIAAALGAAFLWGPGVTRPLRPSPATDVPIPFSR